MAVAPVLTCTDIAQYKGLCLHWNATATARIEPPSFGSVVEHHNHCVTMAVPSIHTKNSYQEIRHISQVWNMPGTSLVDFVLPLMKFLFSGFYWAFYCRPGRLRLFLNWGGTNFFLYRSSNAISTSGHQFSDSILLLNLICFMHNENNQASGISTR